MSMISPAGLPTATVMRASENFSRTARKAGRLITTSPSWPKSMMRMLRGAKVMGNANCQSATQADSLALLQVLIKKVYAGVVGADPILVQQQIMNLVGEDQLFKINTVLSQ